MKEGIPQRGSKDSALKHCIGKDNQIPEDILNGHTADARLKIRAEEIKEDVRDASTAELAH